MQAEANSLLPESPRAWRYDVQCRVIAGLGLFTCAIVGIILSVFERHEYAQLFEEKVAMQRQLADAFAEHAIGTFNLADQTLRYVRRDYLAARKKLMAQTVSIDASEFGRLFNQIAIADEHGAMRMTSIKQPLVDLAKINLSDRPHFQFHLREPKDVTRIGEPLVGRVSNKASIQVSRRISDGNGEFRGIIVTSLAPDYFFEFFRHIADASHSGLAVALVGYDGIVRARATSKRVDYGQNYSDRQEFMSNIRRGQASFESTLPGEGGRLLFVARPIDQYQLAVVVSLPAMEIDKEFADNFFLPRVLAASLISLVMLGGILLIRLRIRELQFVADLREREASLRKAMALQSRMISSVSHELRTPLSSILGYASIIANEDTDQDMQSFGRIIEGSADHLKRVIDGVLDLSKKEAGHVEYVEAQFDVRALVNRCVELFRGGADAKGIVLALRVDSDVGEFFETDPTKLTQIIENLLSNALKNTVAGSIELRVSSAQSGKALEFSVKDTGAGIGPEDMKNLFKMFHRIDDDFHRTLPGSGIGLNIVKEFSQLMGGDVAVDSTLGKGTAFRVTIPAARHRSEVA